MWLFYYSNLTQSSIAVATVSSEIRFDLGEGGLVVVWADGVVFVGSSCDRIMVGFDLVAEEGGGSGGPGSLVERVVVERFGFGKEIMVWGVAFGDFFYVSDNAVFAGDNKVFVGGQRADDPVS